MAVTNRTDEDLDKIGASASNSSEALDDLTAAARKADEIFNNRFVKFGTTVSDLVATLPGLGPSLAKGVSFFEDRFNTLRQFTDYGINFNYNMQLMDTTVTKARMNLTQFAGLVRENSQAFVGLGTSVNEGAINFLNSVDQMLNRSVIPNLENEIAKLGFTTDETVEAFLNYQNQLKFSSYGRRRDEAELHRGFLEYTKTLDELAKLTGKERDKLQEAFIDEARQPSVIARDNQLGGDVQGTSAQIIAELQQFGPTIQNVARDILGQAGVLQGENVYAAQFEFVRTLEAIRAAQDRNDRTEVDRLKTLLAAQISTIPSSEVFTNMSGFQNEFSQFMDKMVGEMASDQYGRGAYLNYQRAQQDLQTRLGRVPSPEEVHAEVRRVLALQTPRAGTGTDDNGNPIRTGQEGYLEFLRLQIAGERKAQGLREMTIDEAYAHFEGIVTGMATLVTNLNDMIANDAEKARQAVRGLIDGMDISASEFQTVVTDAVNSGNALGTAGEDLAGQLQSKFDQYLSETNPVQRAELLSEMERILSGINRLESRTIRMDANNAQITISGSNLRLNPVPGQTGDDDGGRFGTIGRFGRIFKNFGLETRNFPLHGLESVLTPDQLGDLVYRTVSSTLYAANDSLSSSFDPSSARIISTTISSGMSGIEGRLNTLRNNVTNLASMNTNTLEPDQISQIVTSALGSMPRDIRRGFEEALTNTIKTPIEQLVAVNTTNADESTKIRKRIGDMSNNLLS